MLLTDCLTHVCTIKLYEYTCGLKKQVVSNFSLIWIGVMFSFTVNLLTHKMLCLILSQWMKFQMTNEKWTESEVSHFFPALTFLLFLGFLLFFFIFFCVLLQFFLPNNHRILH